jgi:L-aminopeptidase/D-esterase-like protein
MEIPDLMPLKEDVDQGSIIVVAATDAPLLPHQLERMAKRVSLGIGLMGGRGGNSSGDIFIAFSTANQEAGTMDAIAHLEMLPNEKINPIFQAVTSATEEAIVNAMIAAETMEGINGNKVYAIPHDRLIAVLKKYNRFSTP